jgi:hypothetical protein
MAFKISPEVFGIGRDSPAFPPLVVFVSELVVRVALPKMPQLRVAWCAMDWPIS